MSHQSLNASESTPLRDDIRSLGKILGEVIWESDGQAVYDVIEELRRAAVQYRRDGDLAKGQVLKQQIAKLDDGDVTPVVRAFSYFLHLSNIAEDRDQNRRQRQGDQGGGFHYPGERGGFLHGNLLLQQLDLPTVCLCAVKEFTEIIGFEYGNHVHKMLGQGIFLQCISGDPEYPAFVGGF